MAFPRSYDELVAAGYKYGNHGRCRGCDAAIQWWTTPAGKRIPLEFVKKSNTMESHFARCPKAAQYRKTS